MQSDHSPSRPRATRAHDICPPRSAGRARRRLTGALGALALAVPAALPAAASADTVLAGFGEGYGLGIGSGVGPAAPIAIPGAPADAIAAATGGSRSLVLTPGGVLVAGSSTLLGLGDDVTEKLALTPIPDTADVTAISAGGLKAASLLLREDGTVDSFGSNASGDSGGEVGVVKGVPTQVAGLSNVAAIANGNQYSLALDAAGTVWAWGARAQLGNDGATADTGTPVQVRLPSPARQIAAGYTHALALLRNGEVWAWGVNAAGQLGQGNTTPTTAPVQVTGLGGLDVKSVSAGNRSSFALLQDGSFRAWGYGAAGSLGLASGRTTNVTVPSEPAAGTSSLYPAGGFDALEAGQYTTYAITRAGRQLYVWGNTGSATQNRLGGIAQHDFPYGSGNPVTATSSTEVPQRAGRLQNVPWLARGSAGGHTLLLTDTVLQARPGNDTSFFAQEVGTIGAPHSPSFTSLGGSSVITGLGIGGDHPEDFVLVRSGGGGSVAQFPYTIVAGETSGVAVRFAPTDAGLRRAFLQVEAEDETIQIPLEGFGTPATGGPAGERGDKGDTVVVTVPGPPGPAGRDGRDGTFSLAAFRATTTVKRGATAQLSFVLLNGTAATLAKGKAAVTLPRGLRATATRAVALPALKAGASRRFSVPVKVARQARVGTYPVQVRVPVGNGKALTQRVKVRVAR